MTASMTGSAAFNLPEIGEWVHRSACRDADPEMFALSTRTGAPSAATLNRYRLAAAYCDRCPVMAECAVVAEDSQHVGIWGGQLRLGPRRIVDLVEHLYDEAWWRTWFGDRKRSHAKAQTR